MLSVLRAAILAMLTLPARLAAMVDTGLWPRDHYQEQSQNLRPLVPKERVRLFAPDEDTIYLHKPPFHTLAEETGNPIQNFWSKFGALHQILPDRALVIGDFGLGSDAPIILYYAEDEAAPRVLRLQWTEAAPGQPKTDWILVAQTFDAFADMLAIE